MSQITFAFDSPVAAATDPAVAFEIGWDFAHFGLTPPAEHCVAGAPLRQGWDAARTSFGARTLAPTRHTRKWLQLRLNAWRRGRMFEGLQVTPNYLRQIDVERCPITREALTQATCTPSDASIDRVRNDAGYAAGNLVVMSTRANAAKGDADFDDALAQMRRVEATALSQGGGDGAIRADGARTLWSASSQDGTRESTALSAAEWARVAVLCSFVTELPHAQAAALPLLVLPPNRLRLFNPIQALQALVTRQFEKPGWSTRIARLAELLPGKSLRRDFHVFVNALVPRVLEAGQPGSAHQMRWALEDAWRNALVLRCWKRVALQFDATLAERTVLRASALHLADRAALATSFEQATDGWGIAQRGYASLDTATANVPPRRPRPAPRTTPAPAPIFVPAHRDARLAASPAMR
jgi:hypothetical protein